MKRITITRARKNLAELVNQAHYVGEITLLTKHGKDLAAIAPMDIIQPKDVGKMKKKPQREE